MKRSNILVATSLSLCLSFSAVLLLSSINLVSANVDNAPTGLVSLQKRSSNSLSQCSGLIVKTSIDSEPTLFTARHCFESNSEFSAFKNSVQPNAKISPVEFSNKTKIDFADAKKYEGIDIVSFHKKQTLFNNFYKADNSLELSNDDLNINDSLDIWGYPGGVGPVNKKCFELGFILSEQSMYGGDGFTIAHACARESSENIQGMSGGPILRDGKYLGVLSAMFNNIAIYTRMNDPQIPKDGFFESKNFIVLDTESFKVMSKKKYQVKACFKDGKITDGIYGTYTDTKGELMEKPLFGRIIYKGGKVDENTKLECE